MNTKQKAEIQKEYFDKLLNTKRTKGIDLKKEIKNLAKLK